MSSTQPSPPAVDEPAKYGGRPRFDIECEFVQALGNPRYLNHLAANKFFDQPAFVAYLEYLQYWKEPRYVKYLVWPGPTLRALEMLQQESFRRDVLNPQVVAELEAEWMRAAVEWHREDKS